jgi:nucleoside-diphosphate-sugar epimerase
MHILMTGAGGMIGRKLIARLARDGALNGHPVDKLTLVDVDAPPKPDKFAGAVDSIAADISEAGAFTALVAARPDVIFHLAAVVSGEAELDFEKGTRINFDGSRSLLEAIRAIGDGSFLRRRSPCSVRPLRKPSPTIST